jgi:predicted small secreted protein
MKTRMIRFCAMLAVAAMLLSSCTSTTVVVVPKDVPPGHAKKMAGSKSAKPFAPGQQKKKH